MPNFFTLTCNLLAERTLEFERWQPGQTQRAAAESFQVGGKGINVAKMLGRLNFPNTALCFVGGSTGQECADWLRDRRFAFHAVKTTTPTRAGTVVRDRSHQHPETTFLGPDAAPDAAAIAECATFLDAQEDGSVLALCGSVPGWGEPRYEALRGALGRWASRGILVVDSYGPPLQWAVGQSVALIKINADELRGLGEEAQRALRQNTKIRSVITDGQKPVRFHEHGVEGTAVPPVIKEVSATGSGDVLLACLLVALFRDRRTLPQAVQFALPYAVANAAHPSVAEFALPLSSHR